MMKKKITRTLKLLSNFKVLVLLAVLAALVVGCSDMITSLTEIDDTPAGADATALSVGREYQGGIIAYILQSGDPGYVSGETHGIIAATEDQSTEIVWISGGSTQTTLVPSGTSQDLGTGSANTDNIIAQAVAAGNNTPTSYAAGLARAYNGGGYSDWYLPSLYELNKLYLNKTAVGGFSDSHRYWSSSEDEYFSAWSHSFALEPQTQYQDGKGSTLGIRAVRAF